MRLGQWFAYGCGGTDRPKSLPYSLPAHADLEIEHIMPRVWQANWRPPEADDASNALASQARDRALHRIGNLTLVTADFNKAVSNAAWEVKRQALAEHSALQINTTLTSYPAWDESFIELRARSLAMVAAKVWPSPHDLRL